MRRHRWLASIAAVAAMGLFAAGCGSSSSSSSSSAAASSSPAAASSSSSGGSTAASSAVLGTPKKATGSPYVFGMINDETGPVTFPEARAGAQAAASYVNDYLGGINGHPIQIDNCVSDASPATSARCANELIAKKPIAILGAADVGAPATIPIYAHANLAYLGGIPFTPVPEVAPNSIQFWSVSVGDNAAAAVYAAKTLGVKSVALMYFDNPQGKSHPRILPPVFKAAGITNDQDDPALADDSGSEPAGRPGPEQRRPAGLHRHSQWMR